MKVSINWLKNISEQYQSSANLISKGVDDLVEKIGAQLGAVEEVINVGKKYEGVVVVKVVECRKHPNADKLTVCLVDDGGVVKKVKRDKSDLVEIVCGAPNVKAGILAAWIPPGNTVPSTYGEEPLVLEAREIRGIVSSGMLASAKELDIGDDHNGIVEIDKNAKPGESFAEFYKMNDYIIDIENKMFTHRPDLFGHLGIAREVAGIQGLTFKSPKWYREDAPMPSSRAHDNHKLIIKNDLPKLVPRFCALVIKDVKVAPSPLWLRASLSRLGLKSINNIVDLTNFYMLLTAQPLHAYDYDKVKSGVLGARFSKKGEKLKLLGGKEIQLDNKTVVITDGKRPIGLAGIMGGADTEVDENTKTIILECANFDMNATRRVAMQYGLFTEAATRFTKNQSPLQNRAVIAKAAEDILKIAGGRVGGKLIDDKHFSHKEQIVKTDRAFVNERLGLNMTVGEMKKLLENVEFKVAIIGEKLSITAPFWRTDIEIPEDVVEEVGRLYGYDYLPMELPSRNLVPAKINHSVEFKSGLRNILSSAGANELLTYSFVHGSLLEKVGQDPKDSYHIRNAVSPDLQYYRLSLTPSLLEKIHPNIKAGFDKYVIYEIGKVHSRTEKENGLPKEFDRLAVILAKITKENYNGAPFYSAKKYLSYLLFELGLEPQYNSLDMKKLEGHKLSQHMVAPFEPLRSALIYIDGKVAGVIGEYQDQVSQRLKLPIYSAGFEVFISALQKPKKKIYRALSRFPGLDQDICLRSDSKITYAELEEFMKKKLDKAEKEHGYSYSLEPIDIFQKTDDKSRKHTTWRITLHHPDRTLTTEEANKLLDKIATEAKKALKAERI